MFVHIHVMRALFTKQSFQFLNSMPAITLLLSFSEYQSNLGSMSTSLGVADITSKYRHKDLENIKINVTNTFFFFKLHSNKPRCFSGRLVY